MMAGQPSGGEHNLSVMQARGAVKRRPLTNEPGGQAPVRRYRPAGGTRRLLLRAAFAHPAIKCPAGAARAWRPQFIDIPSEP